MRTVLLLLALLLLLAMWLVLVGGTIDDQPAKAVTVRAASVFDPPPPLPTTSSTSTTSTTVRVAPTARTAPSTPAVTGKRMHLSSTEYCETGHMANGQPAHDGAVSSKVLPRGTRWRVLSGQFAGRVFTVEDTGSLAIFDISVPGRCDVARAYGRQPIDIEAA